MINIIINFIKNLFIKDEGKEEISMEALHNMSIPMDTGDDVAKALGHMDEDGEFITESNTTSTIFSDEWLQKKNDD